MNSISPECQELKTQYDACFNKWFKDKYLKGYPQDTMCAALFKAYQNCVKKAIKDNGIDIWDVEKDVLGTDKEKQPPKKPESKK